MATLYRVDFTESGLPTGTLWSVNLSGVQNSSKTSTISFFQQDGTWSYAVAGVGGYVATSTSGTVTVTGAGKNVSIVFTLEE